MYAGRRWDDIVQLGQTLVARRAEGRGVDVVLRAQRRQQIVADLVGRRHW